MDDPRNLDPGNYDGVVDLAMQAFAHEKRICAAYGLQKQENVNLFAKPLINPKCLNCDGTCWGKASFEGFGICSHSPTQTRV